MFMKIINKNANRDVLIILAVSFVLCFSLAFLHKRNSVGQGFLKLIILLFS